MALHPAGSRNVKNVNKNLVAVKAIKELGAELLWLSTDGGPISKVILALATATLNSRIRRNGLSAREILTQRGSTYRTATAT